MSLVEVAGSSDVMGGGEVIKRGWLVKSPPLEGGGIKVQYLANLEQYGRW